MRALPSCSTLRAAFACLVASMAVACTPEIGDDCSNSLNCSSQSSRECDRTQPGGYCTISPCERDTCPEEATCVKFRPSQERLSVTYCMRKCGDDNDCREGDGYRCLTAKGFSGCFEAETLDGADKRFCALPSGNKPVEPPVDASTDASTSTDASVDAPTDASTSTDASVDASTQSVICMPAPATGS
jgi:hypothetical protein